MKLIGHLDFNTTQKYYISISNKRKRLAIEKAYENILEKKRLRKIVEFETVEEKTPENRQKNRF